MHTYIKVLKRKPENETGIKSELNHFFEVLADNPIKDVLISLGNVCKMLSKSLIK